MSPANWDLPSRIELFSDLAKLPPPNHPQGERSVGLVRTIPVIDRNGDQFTLYEFHDRRFLRKVRRMKLETGELVQEIDGVLVVIGTGETLARG